MIDKEDRRICIHCSTVIPPNRDICSNCADTLSVESGSLKTASETEELVGTLRSNIDKVASIMEGSTHGCC